MEGSKTKLDIDGLPKFLRTVSRLILSVLAAGAISACGSTESGVNSNSGNHSKTSLNQNAANAPDVNQPITGVNGQNVEVASQTNKMLQRLEQLRESGANQKPSAAPINSRPAPEDSVMTAQLTDVARETRTWKKNPVLLRVEKSYSGDGSKVKIVLRDGRVFDIDGKEVANLDQISSVAILQLVNVAPPVMQESKSRSRPDPSVVKKPDN